MDMDEIGLDLLQFPDKKPGVDHVEIAVESEEVGKPFGDDPVGPGADVDLVFVAVFQADPRAAAGSEDFVSALAGGLGDIENDIAGRGIIVRVDFNDCLHTL